MPIGISYFYTTNSISYIQFLEDIGSLLLVSTDFNQAMEPSVVAKRRIQLTGGPWITLYRAVSLSPNLDHITRLNMAKAALLNGASPYDTDIFCFRRSTALSQCIHMGLWDMALLLSQHALQHRQYITTDHYHGRKLLSKWSRIRLASEGNDLHTLINMSTNKPLPSFSFLSQLMQNIIQHYISTNIALLHEKDQEGFMPLHLLKIVIKSRRLRHIYSNLLINAIRSSK